MTKFYSGNGDDGKTGILGEGRVEKFDARIEALGTLDELTAALGVARSLLSDTRDYEIILSIQRRLYELMAEVAASEDNAEKFRTITQDSIRDLENTIDRYSMDVESPKGFIIPGETQSSAAVSLARAITRRAERRVVELYAAGIVKNPSLLGYLNRLSSFLFVLEIKLITENTGGQLTLAKDGEK